MPFVQRTVQPVQLAQAVGSGTVRASASGRANKFHCVPGKCQNNNCYSKQLQLQLQLSDHCNGNGVDAADIEIERDEGVGQERERCNGELSRTTATSVKDNEHTSTTVITAIVHTAGGGRGVEGEAEVEGAAEDEPDHAAPLSPGSNSNGFAAASFMCATDAEEATAEMSPATPILAPMKKLRQHVEFLSVGASPTRSSSAQPPPMSATPAAPVSTAAATATVSRRRGAGTTSPSATRIVSGYEFESISNITLSNALRQLASLVLLASDIFDELQRELLDVGERTRVVQRKIVAVEQRVCAYDPKMVTVPESDLLTFAQRKVHYESDKCSGSKELFAAVTRPRAIRTLYEEAGKVTPPPSSASSAAGTPHRSTSFTTDGRDAIGVGCGGDGAPLSDGDAAGGAGTAAGYGDELVCTPVFGKANRKMRTRIDAEIEIRLPAAIEDLRKWTSTEALGDVTVTPDCMAHVDTSLSTSMVLIGDNGVLTPALSPSVLSADAVDALYSINVSSAGAAAVDSTHTPNDINKDVPLNHRLPSPEEQCKIIALRYPAEVISVDTSGKRFERMCMARKSTTGCCLTSNHHHHHHHHHHHNHHHHQHSNNNTGNVNGDDAGTANNLNDDVHTVSRRSRSRKVRGKRRNTIAGIDQKEIQDAANGDSTATSGEIKNALAAAGGAAHNSSNMMPASDAAATNARRADKSSKKFGRSKSSDVLKKESVALPYDKGKNTLTRLNSLKQWGRNRFKFMQRSEPLASLYATTPSRETSPVTGGASGEKSAAAMVVGVATITSNSTTTTVSSVTTNGGVASSATINNNNNNNSTKKVSSSRDVMDIDDECVVHELIRQKGEGRFSHERKPSYSSSEKSVSVSSSGQLKGKLQLGSGVGATASAAAIAMGNVKLRDTSSLNRQRRNGISANGLGGKDEQPHSSSGNWSASSESGRASIGSEITIQPKSSASNTSLNVSSFHPGSSGPPSSMLSRRRFLNTSASSSVTSEGTATPDLQADGTYPNHLDDETSSAYSCDTEGYYTSFHMDSGLRTLKEEESPLASLQSGQSGGLHTSSSYSFGSQSNQTVLSAENEYELFGRGSTSTTTSSAGTVCTTLLVGGSGSGGCEQSSLNGLSGPDVPERISSLGKLNKGSGGGGGQQSHNNSNSASTSTLERSYSSSTIGSTLERTGTIKRNANAAIKLAVNEPPDVDDAEDATATAASPAQEDAGEDEDEEGNKGGRLFSFEQRMRKRLAQPLPTSTSAAAAAAAAATAAAIVAEVDWSESSDLEGVERIERIKQKTAITAKRIPSMCIITPTTSDDENHSRDGGHDGDADGAFEAFDAAFDGAFVASEAYDPNRTLTNEESSPESSNNRACQRMDVGGGGGGSGGGGGRGKAIINHNTPHKDHNLNVVKRSSGYGLNNMFEKLKVVLPSSMKRHSPTKGQSQSQSAPYPGDDDDLYDAAGEYVTIADISNNNNNNNRYQPQLPPQLQAPKVVGAGSLGIYYSSDIVRRRHDAGAAMQANEPPRRIGPSYAHAHTHTHSGSPSRGTTITTEYVSLNELPQHLRGMGRGAAASATYGNVDGGADAAQRQRRWQRECAEAESAESGTSATSMYAEIGERDADDGPSSLYSTIGNGTTNHATTANAAAACAAVVAQSSLENKGARVRLNAQGRIIYDSDSLRRRRGAHTTFAPGPYVKETESALPDSATIATSAPNNGAAVAHNSESASSLSAAAKAKLLFLNGGAAAGVGTAAGLVAPRKVASVRPILIAPSTTTLSSSSRSSQQSQSQQPQQTPQRPPKAVIANGVASTMPALGYQDSSANGSGKNPFYQPAMMASPSTKSTSSTGSSNHSQSSSSGSSHMTTTSTSSSQDEGYQRLFRPHEQPLAPTMAQRVDNGLEATPFQRNTPIYWTLQNRRQPKPLTNGITCRDDLYATPIRRSDRAAAAAAAAAAARGTAGNGVTGGGHFSPIVPRQRNAFLTSTPTRGDADSPLPADNIPAKRSNANWTDNSPERLNTCADRIGQSKTSLMDFKKLLLAKSAKTSPVQKKLSAVELLKKTNAAAAIAAAAAAAAAAGAPATNGGGGVSTLNSSMKLLDLSGSPKTFANRRMLRQGQFGSPSKSFAPKLKPLPAAAAWRQQTVRHTDVMSTTIPEANSEEDQSNTSGSGGSSSSRASLELDIEAEIEAEVVAAEVAEAEALKLAAAEQSKLFDLRRNFFLQTEENNFMRGELKPTFSKTGGAAAAPVPAPVPTAVARVANKYASGPATSAAKAALETAL